MWFGDDRCVPPDDERSNYRMADAARLAMDSASLLERIAPRARELDRNLPNLAELAATASSAIGEAARTAAHPAE